jgi:hypothetical protein
MPSGSASDTVSYDGESELIRTTRRLRHLVASKKVHMAAVKHSGKPRKPDMASGRENVDGPVNSARTERVPSDLNLSNRSSLSDMAPGDIVFLDDYAFLRQSFAAHFVAVLACPLCGSPGLITSTQFSGGAPVICTSKVCSGLFRIVDEAQIVPLPPT